MRTCRTRSLASALFSVCACWLALGIGGRCAIAADQLAGAAEHRGLEDVEDVVDAMVGTTPEHHHPPAEAVNYQNPPLLPEIPLFLFTLALFGGFVLVMRSSTWNPLMAGLNAREGRIIKAETEARAARIEVEQLTTRAESRMAEVHAEVKAIVAQARTEAEMKKLEIVAQAEADAQRIKQQALEQIAQAREAALEELNQTIDQQVALATQHVAGRRL